MHRLSIYCSDQDRVLISAVQFGSTVSSETFDVGPSNSAVELVPQFPTNWPALYVPAPFDEKSKNETKLACNKLQNASTVQQYYTTLWNNIYNADKALVINFSMQDWI